jgi:endogenous inhibitor of DNA gyrase (YacG/DUF329 family)
MLIQLIEITCPDCKNQFSDHILSSLSSTHYEIAKKSGTLEPTRKCPKCHKLVDISDGKNYIYEEPVFTLKQRIKRWFEKFLP